MKRMMILAAALVGVWCLNAAGDLKGGFKSILIDGDLSDWNSGDLLYTDDEIGDGTPDNSSYTNIYVCNDTHYLYIGLACKGSGGESVTNTWVRNVYLDTDMNPNTGFDGGWMTGGYDYRIAYGITASHFSVYSFGGASQTEYTWNWVSLIDSFHATNNAIEWRILRSNFTNLSDRARIEFEVTGDGISEATWAHSSEGSVETYYLDETFGIHRWLNVTQPVSSQWSRGEAFYQDFEISEGAPNGTTYSNIFVANDESNLYFGFECKGSQGASITNGWVRSLYIDTDLQTNTGYNAGWMVGGYDYYIEYGLYSSLDGIHVFTGGLNQAAWAWERVGGVTYSWDATANAVTWQVPRNLLTNLADRIRLRFYVSGDGVTTPTDAYMYENLCKYYTLMGYLPTNLISGLVVAGQDAVLTWDATNDCYYTLQYRDSLTLGDWVDVPPTNRAGPAIAPFEMKGTNTGGASASFRAFRVTSYYDK